MPPVTLKSMKKSSGLLLTWGRATSNLLAFIHIVFAASDYFPRVLLPKLLTFGLSSAHALVVPAAVPGAAAQPQPPPIAVKARPTGRRFVGKAKKLALTAMGGGWGCAAAPGTAAVTTIFCDQKND
jgi:hypothetical protein